MPPTQQTPRNISAPRFRAAPGYASVSIPGMGVVPADTILVGERYAPFAASGLLERLPDAPPPAPRGALKPKVPDVVPPEPSRELPAYLQQELDDLAEPHASEVMRHSGLGAIAEGPLPPPVVIDAEGYVDLAQSSPQGAQAVAELKGMLEAQVRVEEEVAAFEAEKESVSSESSTEDEAAAKLARRASARAKVKAT